MSTELTKNNESQAAMADCGCRTTTFTPRVDIVETEGELRLYADLPGVRPEDLDIRYENGELSLVGKVASRHAEGGYLLAEYGVGDFYRSYSVNETIDAERISAEMHDGVLALHLPKTEATKPRRIEVTSS